MNYLLRRLLSHFLCDEATDGTEGSSGGAAPAAAAVAETIPADDAKVETPASEATPKAPATDAEVSEGMANEILGAIAKKDGEGKPIPAKKDEAEEAKPQQETPEQLAQKLDKEKKDAAAALGKKKADDFNLSEEQKKAVGQSANRRFHDLHQYAKLRETENTQLREQNDVLAKTRDEVLGLFQEHKAGSDDIAQLLTYNLLLKDGKFDDALAMLDEQRLAILKHLGRDAPGFDALQDFPELKGKVDALEMSRADALRIAEAERIKRTAQDRESQQNQQQQQEQNIRDRGQKAMSDIDKWEKTIKGKDLDYDAKYAKMSAIDPATGTDRIKMVISGYPPELWLPTLRALYEAQAVERRPGLNGGDTPLRPSGAKGGQAAAKSMEEEIGRSLGLNI